MLKPTETSSDRFWPTLKYQPYWYVVVLLIMIAAIATQFDVYVARNSSTESLRGDLVRIIVLSELFAHGFGVTVVLVGILLMVPDKRKYLPRLTLCAILPSLIVHGFKVCFGRIRPIQFHREFPDSIADSWLGFLPGEGLGFNLEYASQAFPSAHTAVVISFAIALSWLFPRGRILFFTLAILAAVQRVVFEAHWMSDVCVGAAIGVMVGSSMKLNWGFGYWCSLIEKRASTRLTVVAADRHEQDSTEKNNAA